MSLGFSPVPKPANEPVRSYAPGSPERASLKKRLDEMMKETVEVPLIIGGREVKTSRTMEITAPHDHRHVLGVASMAGPEEVRAAAEAARAAWHDWAALPWEARAAVLLKAADLLAGPWRDTLNAATMLCQSKTVFQAEIDSACELTDFWRFNPYYLQQLLGQQPGSAKGIWDYVEYRALEGFIFALTPFNFTSIAGNLPTAPILLGNVVIWKPASTAILSGYYLMRLLMAAGVPPGVINFLPGSGAQVGDPVIAHPDFAGIHFTGSTDTFRSLWRGISDHLPDYSCYPRIVGETGGKDFIFAHPSAEVPALATAMVRGAFEYQGQKCSAASRAYIPRSLWPAVKAEVERQVGEITMGSPLDFRNFMCAVIDKRAYDKIMGYVEEANNGSGYEVITGGKGDSSEGYFIEPTVVVSEDPRSRLMSEEIFGPVLTVHLYDDKKVNEAVAVCDTTSPYGLTGAIFATDRLAINELAVKLRYAAGNFYINDKPTGAVVGQQPFGGARASGTNDKAGSFLNLLRWASQRAIKENFVPPSDFRYPHMEEE